MKSLSNTSIMRRCSLYRDLRILSKTGKIVCCITRTPCTNLRRCRYLEDYLPLLSYCPSGKGVKAPSEKEKNALMNELGSKMDEKCITAVHNILRSERVDVDVCRFQFIFRKTLLMAR